MLTHEEATHDALIEVTTGLDLHVRAMKQRVGVRKFGTPISTPDTRPEVVRFCVYRGSEPVRDWVDTYEQAAQDLADFASHCVANYRSLQPRAVSDAVARLMSQVESA